MKPNCPLRGTATRSMYNPVIVFSEKTVHSVMLEIETYPRVGFSVVLCSGSDVHVQYMLQN